MKSLLIATVLTLSGLAVGQQPPRNSERVQPCDQIPVGGHIYTAGHCEGYEMLPWGQGTLLSEPRPEDNQQPAPNVHFPSEAEWKKVLAELAALKQRVAELEKAWLKAAKGEPDAIRYGHACGQDERLVPTQDINISTHTTTLSWTCVKWWAEAAGK